jgi:hypothetical protein
MFKLRKRKSPFVTLRAEDLQVGDRFVYDCAAIEVLDVAHQNKVDTIVRLVSTHPGSRVRTRNVELPNELLITVARY